MSEDEKKDDLKKLVIRIAAGALGGAIGGAIGGPIGGTLIPVIEYTFDYIQRSQIYQNLCIEDLLQRIFNKCRKIPNDQLQEPPLNIIGPALEASKYYISVEEMREIFANLLAHACDKEMNEFIHPAFVEIIKQMSSDECKMIKYLHESPSIPKQYIPMLKIRQQINNGGVDLMPYFSDICYITGCQYPKKFPEYLNNLHRLGLVEVFYDRFLTNEKLYIDLKEHKAFPRFLFYEEDILVESKGMYGLSKFGEKFCAVCLG